VKSRLQRTEFTAVRGTDESSALAARYGTLLCEWRCAAGRVRLSNKPNDSPQIRGSLFVVTSVTESSARSDLIEALSQRGVADARTLAAMSRVDRARFLPSELAERAYEDTSLPIGRDQTISQPTVVAMMTTALHLTGAERVLEIGAGSGYQAAVLAELAGQVVTVERVDELRERAKALLAELGYANVSVEAAGDVIGWPAGAPYDRIIVTAGGPQIPPELLDQLAIGGRLVMPVGSLAEQRIVLAVRTQDGADVTDLGRVRFVPLIGSGGWPADATIPQPTSEDAPPPHD